MPMISRRLLMSLLITLVALSAALAQEPLVLARDGKALATIVAKPGNTVSNLAAKELKSYLDRITGAQFTISASAEASPRIFIGDCPQARAAGLDVAPLKRDGYFRGVVGEDLYLLGRDAPTAGKLAVTSYFERGSLFAVYDFLEDVCGVRFIKAGPHGEVIPKAATLSVSRAMVREEPVFLDRSLVEFGLPTANYPDRLLHVATSQDPAAVSDRTMWGFKHRWEAGKMVAGCHSAHYLNFDERFAADHPDWFALLPNGQRAIETPRGSYLCYSHPGVAKAFTEDARAYFSGQKPETRGLKTWNKGGYREEFMVDPHDSYPYCKCEECQKIFKADPDQDFSEIIFGAVAKVAEGVQDFPGTYITTLAYGPKIQPPKTVKLPSNVRVRLCVNGPLNHSMPGTRERQLDLIKRWSERMDGDLVLWTYTDQARPTKPIAGVPQVESHSIADFLRAVKPYCNGAFFENESTSQTFRCLDEYVTMKLLWNPDQDVDALLKDYFTSFYGPAAEPIGAIYARLEDLWRKVYTIYGGDSPRYASRVDLWEKIYTEEELAGMGRLVAEAEKLAAGDEAYAWRVGMVRDEMVGRLRANREEYKRTLGVASQAQVTCYRAPVEAGADGLLPLEAWAKVPHEVLGPAMKTTKLDVLTHFKTAWSPDTLHLLFECEEPDPASDPTMAERKPDEADLWKDQTVEYMLTLEDERIMSQSQYHTIINNRGVVCDMQRALGKQDLSWNGNPVVKAEKTERGWVVRVAAPLAAMGIADAAKLARVSFNVARHRPRVDKEHEYFAWSPASRARSWTEATTHGQLIFSDEQAPEPPVNLLRNGSLDAPNERGKFFLGWGIPNDNVDDISRDSSVRWDGTTSARFHAKEPKSIALLQYVDGVKPGRTYRFSCKVRLENIEAEPGHNGAYVNFSAPDFNMLVPLHGLRGTSEWRNLEFEGTTAAKFPEGRRPYVRLRLANCTGTAWFDEVSLIEVKK
ncbi:MAG: DUF4838 domain-containing protein [Armatimonadota bacterium]